MNDDKVKIEPQIVENKQGKPTNPNLLETSKKVEEINETFKENLSRNPIKPTEGKDIIAYHEVEPKKDEFDDLYNELREKYKTDDISIRKDESGKLIASINNQSEFNTHRKSFKAFELERKSTDVVILIKKQRTQPMKNILNELNLEM